MRLTKDQTRDIYQRTGAWLLEACDKCLKPINLNVSYRRGGRVLCSQVCRDGYIYAPGSCAYCGAGLDDKRRGARFCGEKCRKRFVRLRREVQDTSNIADTDLTKSISYAVKI